MERGGSGEARGRVRPFDGAACLPSCLSRGRGAAIQPALTGLKRNNRGACGGFNGRRPPQTDLLQTDLLQMDLLRRHA